MKRSEPANNPKSNNSLESLLRIGHEPRSELDLTALLNDVLSITVRSVSADGGSILVLDEGGWPSHWFVLEGGMAEFSTLAHARDVVDKGMASWVIQHRRGDLVNDVSKDPRWLQLPNLASGIKQGSALCLPLLVYDRVTGVLTLIHQERNFFKPRHLKLLQSIAQQVALPIENARLYDTVRQRAEEMAALYDVTLNISADQPLNRLLDTIVAQAMDLLQCQGGGLFLWREQEKELELVAAYDPEIDLRGARLKPGEGLAGRVFETGEPMGVDEFAPSNVPDEIASGLSVPAAIAAPLVWQGQPIGVLMATDRSPERHFDHNHRHLLTLLAHQSASAIASAQLHERTSRSLEELTFLNETIQDITATLDLNEIFAILTQRVKDLLRIEACSIALVDRDRQDLVFYVASGGGAETVLGERVPWGQGIVGAAAQSGKPMNVPDVTQDDRFYQAIDEKQAEFVTSSILAVPMLSRGRVVGVVEALNKAGGFDAEDERLLNALASLAASVVENAHLFNSVRAAETRYQTLFEDAADAAWVTDIEGKIIQANRKAASLVGVAEADTSGRTLWEQTLSEERGAWREALAQAVSGAEPTFESWIIGADGTASPLELRLKRIHVENGFLFETRAEPHVVRVQWIGRDVSARRELEELRESLANMIVHDLRSPVGTVSTSLGLLGGLIEQESDQAAQLLDIASRATQRLSNLVDSLLDISRLEAGYELTDQVPVPLRSLVGAAVDQVALYAQRKHMQIEVELPDRLPLVLADRGMIERVLVNLLDNALKFTPAGGTVNLSADSTAHPGTLTVRVRDNGPGIPPQYQRRIFDKFAQVRDQFAKGGFGLGLAFCRLAVEAHGGRIWIESPPGEGSIFSFTLPLASGGKS